MYYNVGIIILFVVLFSCYRFLKRSQADRVQNNFPFYRSVFFVGSFDDLFEETGSRRIFFEGNCCNSENGEFIFTVQNNSVVKVDISVEFLRDTIFWIG